LFDLFAKLKAHLRKPKQRTIPALHAQIGRAIARSSQSKKTEGY
jgi:hypothetical protein